MIEKINYFESILDQQEESYADTFKADIAIYFNNDFSEDNIELAFLENLNSEEEIQNWVNKLTSRFVMKFDSEDETENDFIYDYIVNG